MWGHHENSHGIDHLRYAAHRGLTLNGASPEVHAAILRFLDTRVAMRLLALAYFNTRTEDRQEDEAPPNVKHAQAANCIMTLIRLLYLPQLVPGHVDMNASLAMGAALWRMARDLRAGPAEWKADLNHLRTHLKALGREHDCHRLMRALEPYGPAVDTRQAQILIEEALTLHSRI